MQKCLGIYVEENLIKYAKLSKERDKMKVESFGIRFFQDLSQEIEAVIEETYSFGVPISINIANEKYLYFDVFAYLTKKDIQKTVQTEFVNYCEEKNYNPNALEHRFAIMKNIQNEDKVRALDIYVNTIELNRQIAPFTKHHVSKIVPISVAIGNIANLIPKENQLIVNMEDNTTITTIYNKQIYNVETLDIGAKEVLESINRIENSYAKAYDICKNTTIYTVDVEETAEEQPYLQSIMPTIYNIAEKIQEIVEQSPEKISTVYLTGTLSVINNIDLYFQELLQNCECKILKPTIIDEATTKINIKDYVEVNSAIALATAGLGEGVQELNFQKITAGKKLARILSIELPMGGKSPKANMRQIFDLSGTITNSEKWMIRSIAEILIILIIYGTFSGVLSNQMLDKEDEIVALTNKQNSQIQQIEADNSTINSKTDRYKVLISELNRINQKISDAAARRNSIPNLLNQIMYNIPDRVKLAQIENTKEKTVVINAVSKDYDQLGYFVAILKTKKILKNVITSSTAKPDGTLYISIEGELP